MLDTINNFCKDYQYIIEAITAVSMFFSVVISLWLALRNPSPKIKAELYLMGTNPNDGIRLPLEHWPKVLIPEMIKCSKLRIIITNTTVLTQ